MTKSQITKSMGEPDYIDINKQNEECISYENILEIENELFPVLLTFYFDIKLVCHAQMYGYPKNLASSLINSFNEYFEIVNLLIWKDKLSDVFYEMYIYDHVVLVYIYQDGNKYGSN